MSPPVRSRRRSRGRCVNGQAAPIFAGPERRITIPGLILRGKLALAGPSNLKRRPRSNRAMRIVECKSGSKA